MKQDIDFAGPLPAKEHRLKGPLRVVLAHALALIAGEVRAPFPGFMHFRVAAM